MLNLRRRVYEDMAKKQKYKPYDFQKSGSSNLSATIYASVLESPAFLSLPLSARALFVYMQLQLYGQRAVDDDETIFFFNRALWLSRYKLYKKWEQFDRDRRQLIQHGFIEEVENGSNTRTKNKYKFSDKWKQWQ